jgi:hypothetical protein
MSRLLLRSFAAKALTPLPATAHVLKPIQVIDDAANRRC